MRGRARLFIAATSLLVAACGPSEQPGPAAASPASSDEAATLDGKALVEARCTVCHSTARIEQATFDRAGWEKTVSQMIKTGARLTDAERKTVIDYLASR